MRRFTSVLFLIILTTSLYSSPTSEWGKRKKKEDNKESGISVGLARAWVLYNNKDYYGALRIYRDLYKKAPSNANLNYRMGVCFEATNKKDSALFHLNKAIATDSTVNNNAYYYIGKSYQFNEDLDKAIDNYYTFKSKEPKNKTDVNRLLRQCETAKYMLANPVNVKITNLGPNINTEFVDASPSITADQELLVFTSRRKENVGGKICPSNEQYYDDIYTSKWDDNKKEWAKAENIGAPINTNGFDANLSISPDGQKIFIYKNIEGETGSGDIYVSTFNNDQTWSKPTAFGMPKSKSFVESSLSTVNDYKYINSSYFESSASITSDGKTLYFVSERERGGLGFGDIWTSTKVAGQWQKPVNIGPVINTEFDEVGVYIHPDGKTLFFSSEGHNAIGKHDIFISTKNEKGEWSEPINMGYPINTTKDEIHFVLSASKDKAYISSTRPNGFGMIDIYEVDMSKYFKSNKNISNELADKFTSEKMAVLRGSIVDSDSGKPVKAQIQIENTKTKESITIHSEDNGNYFATLPVGYQYSVRVISKTHKSFTFKVKMKDDKSKKTPSLTKHIVLNRK